MNTKEIATQAVMAVALIALIILSLISYRTITRLTALATTVDQSHAIQLNLQKTYSSISDADSEFKSFLITGDSSYYQRLVSENNTIRNALQALHILTGDSDPHAKALQSLEKLTKARTVYMDSSMRNRRASSPAFSSRVDHYNGRLKTAIDSLVGELEKSLAVETKRSHSYQVSAPANLLIFQVLLGVVLLVAFVLINANFRTRARLTKRLDENNIQVKRQRDFVQSILDNTVDSIIIFDLKRQVIGLNKRAGKIFDPAADAMGKEISQIYPPSFTEKAHQAVGAVLLGNEYLYRDGDVLAHGGNHYESYFVPLSSDGIISGGIVIHHDITSILKATAHIQEINNRLTESNQDLERFAYVASHDLQEPLRKIRTFSDLAAKNVTDRETVKANLERVSKSAERMSTLIRDILNFSRISNEQSAPEPVALDAALEQVLQDFELLIQERGAVIRSEPLPVVPGSMQQLTQVFFNIISNALKFSRNEPIIQVSCKQHADHCEITIADNGIGFDQVHAREIFEVFKRLHGRAEYAGTGIGLALCKRVVQKHGGTITATSALNQGTSITITLPMYTSA